MESNATTAPIAELGEYIFGDKGNLCVTANEFELLGGGLRSEQSEVCSAIRRSDDDVRVARLNACVKDQVKAKLVDEEVQAAVQIADKDGDGLKTQVRIIAVQANRGFVKRVAGKIVHGGTL